MAVTRQFRSAVPIYLRLRSGPTPINFKVVSGRAVGRAFKKSAALIQIGLTPSRIDKAVVVLLAIHVVDWHPHFLYFNISPRQDRLLHQSRFTSELRHVRGKVGVVNNLSFLNSLEEPKRHLPV